MKRTMFRIWTTYYYIFFILVIGLALFFIQITLKDYALDDAYIHFRIVNNFIENGVPYYNIEEALKVSTSSGWIVLLSAVLYLSQLLRLPFDLPVLAALVNASMLIIGWTIYSIILTKYLTRSDSKLYFILFFLLFVTICLASSVGLMETTTSLVILGIGILLILNGKMYGFIFMGMSLFFRPEFVIPVGLFTAYAMVKAPKKILSTLLFLLTGVLPFVVFDLVYYGTIVPHTVIAKSIIYALPRIDSVETILSRVRNSFFMFPGFVRLAGVYLFFALFIPSLFIGVFILRSLKKKSLNYYHKSGQTWLFLLWGMGILVLYIYGRVHVFLWYDPLYLVPLLMVIGYVLLTSTNSGERIFQSILLAPMVIASALIIIQYLAAGALNPAYFPAFSEGARARQYVSIGQTLYSRYPNANLMTSEIGGLGYGFKGEIIDAAGLATPEALKYAAEGSQASHSGGISLKYIGSKRPDIIVSYDIFIDYFSKEILLDQYSISSYPLFLEDDITRSTINTPWGNQYKRIYSDVEFLHVFINKDLLRSNGEG